MYFISIIEDLFMTPHLISIAPSHYCEKTRWALSLARIEFTESRHAPFFHISAVKIAGGTRTTPTLQLKNRTLTDSTDITEWIALHPSTQWNPYGKIEHHQRVKDLEFEFGRKLGVLTRLITYQDLLPHKNLTVKAMTGASDKEIRWFSLGYPIFSWLMKKGMNINADAAQKAVDTVQQIFDAVEQDADGEFLVGDRLTIADVTFASLAGPLVMPEQYGATLPALEELPQATLDLCQRFRSHPAGVRTLRLYREHR